MMKTLYWVYILECNNGSYYTGYTNHLIKRYHLHLSGKASKFTRSFKPLRLLQHWVVAHQSTALRLEKHIKSLTRAEKERIISEPGLLEGIIVTD